MIVTTFRTSGPNSPTSSSVNIVDATASNIILTIDDANKTAPNTQITIIKGDPTANTVTIKDATGTSYGVLSAHNSAITIFCDGIEWSTTGVVQGAEQISAPRITEIHTTGVLDVKVITFSPGSATPVNFWNLSGSGAGDPLQLGADGTDTDVSISFVPKGAGTLQEGLTDVALASGSAQANSTAILLSTLVTDFNSLLAKLRTSRVLLP